MKDRIRAKALELGFDLTGIAPAAVAPEAQARLTEFLARGYHGDMGWMAAKVGRRGDPRRLWPEARSVVVVGSNYGPQVDPLALLEAWAERNACPQNDQLCRTAVWFTQNMLLGNRSDMDQIATAIRKIQHHAGALKA